MHVADQHFRAAEYVASRLVDDGKTDAVALHGSVVKATHRPDSDVDLVAITQQWVGLTTFDVDGIRVEVVGRRYEDWIEVFPVRFRRGSMHGQTVEYCRRRFSLA